MTEPYASQPRAQDGDFGLPSHGGSGQDGDVLPNW